MKFYLSSYGLGDKSNLLKELVSGGKGIGFIPNALDHVDAEPRRKSNDRRIAELEDAGLRVEMLDLREYFGRKEELKKKLDSLGGVWVRGGNTFVLRQAMMLSGFDEIIKNLRRDDFLYGGFSAGVCVLAPDFKAIQNVDNPDVFPYKECRETLWEGLGILDYIVLPHYKSDHPESKDIDKEIEFCNKNNIPFKALRDGEVIIL